MKHLGTLVLAGGLTLASLPTWQRHSVPSQQYQLRPMPIMSFDSSNIEFSAPRLATEVRSEIQWLDYLQKKKDAAKSDYKTSTKQ